MFIYNDLSADIDAQMNTFRPERAAREVIEENGLHMESLALTQNYAASFVSSPPSNIHFFVFEFLFIHLNIMHYLIYSTRPHLPRKPL